MQYEQKPITERSLLLWSAREAIEGPLVAVCRRRSLSFERLLTGKQTLISSISAAENDAGYVIRKRTAEKISDWRDRIIGFCNLPCITHIEFHS
jgi:hypothetical protein